MKKGRRSGWVLNAAIVALALGAGLFASIKPWQAYHEQRAAAESQAEATRSAEKERAGLLRKQAEAGSPIGKEIHARQLGFVRQGQQLADTP